MKPILFNTDMVQAIREGRKTVTRRLVKFLPGFNPDWTGFVPDGSVLYGSNNIPAAKAPYKPGDILYVRETWAEMPYGYVYRADDERPEGWDSSDRWRPSIHMPKEAARIFLRVTSVRAERLQSISPGECEREGAVVINNPLIREDLATYRRYSHQEMAALWDSTIKPKDLHAYGWEANPWVWVIEFERCDKEGNPCQT